jgi:hypothetical protein
MSKWFNLFSIMFAFIFLTACKPAEYQPKRLRCDFGTGQDQIFEPVYKIGVYDGFIHWYISDGFYKKHYPSTDCMVTEPVGKYPTVLIDGQGDRVKFILNETPNQSQNPVK